MQKEAIKVLEQLQSLLYAIPHSVYEAKLPILHHSSIGMHVRHVLEFYQCLYNTLPAGKVDYDQRKRNLRYETSLSAALSAFDDIKNRILNTDDYPLSLHVSYGESSCCLSGSLMRELVYNIEHTVHHMAIIKIALSYVVPGIAVPEGFGVASSTLNYRNSIGVAGQ